MDSTRRRISQRLQLDGIPLDTILAKRLPPRLAFGYHVLPLALENNRVTIAMADPGNKFAVEAVRSALGATPYIVKSDQSWIDKLLFDLWPNYQDNDLHLLICSITNRPLIAFREYSNYIRNLFMVPESNISSLHGIGKVCMQTLEESIDVLDLLFLEETIKPKHGNSCLQIPEVRSVIKKYKPSVLIAREPQWPLRKILIVLGCENRDHVTLDWIMKLAIPSQAEVTILAPIPPVPRMYHGLPGMSVEIPKIINDKSALGEHLECLVGRLEAHGVNAELKVPEGDPKWVIYQEVIEEDYDLIAVTAEPDDWFKRILLRSVVDPVLGSANRPIFIARPLSKKIESVT
jgi:nucleotide-binding universal stress UspA family protein